MSDANAAAASIRRTIEALDSLSAAYAGSAPTSARPPSGGSAGPRLSATSTLVPVSPVAFARGRLVLDETTGHPKVMAHLGGDVDIFAPTTPAGAAAVLRRRLAKLHPTSEPPKAVSATGGGTASAAGGGAGWGKGFLSGGAAKAAVAAEASRRIPIEEEEEEEEAEEEESVSEGKVEGETRSPKPAASASLPPAQSTSSVQPAQNEELDGAAFGLFEIEEYIDEFGNEVSSKVIGDTGAYTVVLSWPS